MSAHFYISNKILRGVTNSVITPNFYDSNGIRVSKTANDTTHTYFTEGSRIRAEKRVYAPASGEAAASNTPSDSTSLSRASGLFSQENSGASLNNSAQIPGVLPLSDVYTYIYDASSITGMSLNPSGTFSSTEYFFLKNQQGDVKFIVDANGNTLNEYVYDAWGNHKIYKYLNGTILTDSSKSPIDISHNPDYTNDIGNLNPFRYRGYYFDAETGWYYLNSRYYDPQTRRFLNADDPSIPLSDQATIFGGLNLYSYCLNNPVNMVDPSGYSVLGFFVGLAVSSLIMWGLGEIFGHQLIGGIGSVAGGAGAISTGVSLMAFGPLGWVLGGLAIIAGAANIAFGSAEIQQHFTGSNWIQDVTGMSAGLYDALYFASNIASSASTIAGNFGMRYASNRILNSIATNPSNINNYRLWQVKTYGKYTSQWTSGTLGHSRSGKQNLRLTDGGNRLISWSPGSSYHGNVPYWKVSSAQLGTFRYDYYLKEILDSIIWLI